MVLLVSCWPHFLSKHKYLFITGSYMVSLCFFVLASVLCWDLWLSRVDFCLRWWRKNLESFYMWVFNILGTICWRCCLCSHLYVTGRWICKGLHLGPDLNDHFCQGPWEIQQVITNVQQAYVPDEWFSDRKSHLKRPWSSDCRNQLLLCAVFLWVTSSFP